MNESESPESVGVLWCVGGRSQRNLLIRPIGQSVHGEDYEDFSYVEHGSCLGCGFTEDECFLYGYLSCFEDFMIDGICL